MKITNRNDTADADDAETIALFQLDERLTRADRAMLQAALVHPVDVEIIAPAPTAYTALWLAHYKLIDNVDRSPRPTMDPHDNDRREAPAEIEEDGMRKDWDGYFMDIARAVATRSTCDRKFVGAVIVRDKRILATGYNGSVRGQPHCDDAGHMMEDGHCVRTVHAEANAIVQAASHGACIEGAGIYVTASPCWPCFKLLSNAGVIRIVFGELYRDARIYDFCKQLGIELVDMSGSAR